MSRRRTRSAPLRGAAAAPRPAALKGAAAAGPRAPQWAPSAGPLAAEWAPTAARILLGLVLAWFGYHELVQPSLWTGYVPLVPTGSATAVVLVLGHGWLLLMLAVALIAGIVPRASAAAAAVVLLEIVIWLTATAGLSDLTLRDVGVLGLAVCLTGRSPQHLVLRR